MITKDNNAIKRATCMEERAVRALIQASTRMEVSSKTRNVALVLYHKFRLLQTEETEDLDYLVAAAAFSLSCKANNEEKEQCFFINNFYFVVNNFNGVLDPLSAEYKEIRDSLREAETSICIKLRNRINPILAQQFLVPFLSAFYDTSPISSVCRNELNLLAMRIVSNFYLHRLCVMYEAQHVAIASIEFALETLGLMKFVLKNNHMWFKHFCHDLSRSSLLELKRHIETFIQDAKETTSMQDQMANIEIERIVLNARKEENPEEEAEDKKESVKDIIRKLAELEVKLSQNEKRENSKKQHRKSGSSIMDISDSASNQE